MRTAVVLLVTLLALAGCASTSDHATTSGVEPTVSASFLAGPTETSPRTPSPTASPTALPSPRTLAATPPVSTPSTGIPSTGIPSAAVPSPGVPSPGVPSSALLATPPVPAPGTATPLVIPTLPTAVDHGIVPGADASWPQCPKGMGIPQKRSKGEPMPLPSARFVVLGLTDGPGFVANPCLASQVSWVKQRHLLASAYSVLSTPVGHQLATYGKSGPYDASTRTGRMANVGYREALFNVETMRGAGLQTPIVWLDVEPVPGFDWPTDTAANAAVVEGAERGYRRAGYEVGVYSIASLWTRVVGNLQLGLPEWRPATSLGRAAAMRSCGAAFMFQGGAAVLGQWVQGDRDRDLTCPGQSVYLSLWFHQY